MKFVIELEEIEGTGLYKAKGFNTLVFDKIGIEKLQPLDTGVKPLQVGDIIKTPSGSVEYQFCGFSNTGKINAINLNTGGYCSLGTTKVVVVRRGE